MAFKPRPVRMVKVVAPDGTISEQTVANARDFVRACGYRYYSADDKPKEQEPIVGEQRSIEDAVQTDDADETAGDPSPDDIEPEQDEDTKSEASGSI